ncbi:MAG: pyruvate kinase [Oscillospiraceae bacterium]|nr:pyruvate kinase [Oscillospiraceae bacterium]
MNRTKIVCTLGPATVEDSVLCELIKSGMNVARLNFSHGDHDSHREKIMQLKRLREEMNLPIATLLDTKGPEVRVKTFEKGKIALEEHDTFILTTAECEGNEHRVSITYKDLPKDIKVGVSILIDDGLIEMTVTEMVESDDGETDIHCRVISGGILSNNKSCNFPGQTLSMPYLSERDKSDIIFGCEMDFDFIACSFVRCDEDVLEVRRVLEENGGKDIRIIAKIENQDGVDNIDEILRVADGIMVARGDMGVEVPFEELPRIQKELIKKAYNSGKQAITATQMLDSMIKNPRPTRAETTDVANAIYDGTSALMLSGETAAGVHPIEALRTMVKIATTTEQNIDYKKRFFGRDESHGGNVTNAIAHASVTTAIDLGARAILTVTEKGGTARLISKFRPPQPILACTPNVKTWRQLSMAWGVIPIMFKEQKAIDELFEHSVDVCENLGHLSTGDLAVITSGVPLGMPGTTNLMKVHVVGDVLVRGSGIGEKEVTAPVYAYPDAETLMKDFTGGSIIVVSETNNKMMPILKSAAGIVVEKGGIDSHAAIVGLSLDIPVIVGAENATKILKTGTTVTINAKKGLVSASERENNKLQFYLNRTNF